MALPKFGSGAYGKAVANAAASVLSQWIGLVGIRDRLKRGGPGKDTWEDSVAAAPPAEPGSKLEAHRIIYNHVTYGTKYPRSKIEQAARTLGLDASTIRSGAGSHLTPEQKRAARPVQPTGGHYTDEPLSAEQMQQALSSNYRGEGQWDINNPTGALASTPSPSRQGQRIVRRPDGSWGYAPSQPAPEAHVGPGLQEPTDMPAPGTHVGPGLQEPANMPAPSGLSGMTSTGPSTAVAAATGNLNNDFGFSLGRPGGRTVFTEGDIGTFVPDPRQQPQFDPVTGQVFSPNNDLLRSQPIAQTAAPAATSPADQHPAAPRSTHQKLAPAGTYTPPPSSSTTATTPEVSNSRQPNPMGQVPTGGYGTYRPTGGGAGEATANFVANLVPFGLLDVLKVPFMDDQSKRRTQLNNFIRDVQASNLHDNIKHNWVNWGIDYNKHVREWAVRDAALKGGQAIDIAQWNSEDWFRDNQFRMTQGLLARRFDMGQWRADQLGALNDKKARFDTNIGNMYRSQSTQLGLNKLWAQTALEGRVSDMNHAISRHLENSIVGVRNKLRDTREGLSDYMYARNQQIEDQLYEASLQLGENASIRDMQRVTDGWREKVKMESRAAEKLFRGDAIQEKAFQDKVARKQFQMQLLSSGDSRGSVAMADPMRAKRIASLSQLQGPAYMAAERLTRLSAIGTTLDMVEDKFKDDPRSWHQSKKILQFMLDALEEQ